MRTLFVDCRWELGVPGKGRELYLDGHIPGAAFLDVEEDLSDLSVERAGRHPLPSAERFAEAASRAGIGAGTLVVAYGSLGGAERLWWLLRHFGHDGCGVLLGGLAAWGGAAARRSRADRARGVRVPVRGRATRSRPRRSPGGSATPRSFSSTPARRTAGAASRTRSTTRTGRIPGARNAPWAEPLPELPAGELAAYCGSGVTSCVTLHRAWLEGREGRLYPGSWSEWSQRGLPLERG